MKNNLDKKLKYPIKVIEKTVKILELFSTDNIKLNYKEIAKLTSINITTTQRILNNLYHYGFLNFNEEDMKYYIGKNLLKLGLIALENSGIGELIRISDVYLRKLNKITNETVSLGTIEMNKTIVLKSFPSSLQTKFEVPIGSSSPLYAGSAGKLFLAFFSDEDLINYLENTKLIPFTKNTITDPKLLLKEIEKIRRNRYSISTGERLLEGRSISFPILNNKNEIVASINIYALKERFTIEKINHLIPLITNCAKEISSKCYGLK